MKLLKIGQDNIFATKHVIYRFQQRAGIKDKTEAIKILKAKIKNNFHSKEVSFEYKKRSFCMIVGEEYFIFDKESYGYVFITYYINEKIGRKKSIKERNQKRWKNMKKLSQEHIENDIDISAKHLDFCFSKKIL